MTLLKNNTTEIQKKALSNAVSGESLANYDAIFNGFALMGINMADVKPRENVFTFNAWKALGRVVKKGQHGIKIVTVVSCTKKDRETGEEVPVKKIKTTTVFHVSQTEEALGKPAEASTDIEISETVVSETAKLNTVQIEVPQELNAYEARIEAKRERYEERACKAQVASQAAHSQAHKMAEAIPFGQPILVGHHSENRDRNYRKRIHNTFGKAFALQDKANHYTQKAASVGTGGISSDDPAAIEKLRSELVSLTTAQEQMKATNKVIRSNKTPETQTAALISLGFNEAIASQLLKKDFAGRIGFASYALTNNNANMTRIKKRIAELESRRKRADLEQVAEGFTYREDTTENRVMFVFEDKPDATTREILKRHAFKWSPTRSAWVRQLNNAGIWSGRQVFKQLSVNPVLMG